MLGAAASGTDRPQPSSPGGALYPRTSLWDEPAGVPAPTALTAPPDKAGSTGRCAGCDGSAPQARPPLPLPKVAAAVRTADWNCRYGAGGLPPPSRVCLRERKPAHLWNPSLAPRSLSHLSPGSAGSAALARSLSLPAPLRLQCRQCSLGSPLRAPACLGRPSAILRLHRPSLLGCPVSVCAGSPATAGLTGGSSKTSPGCEQRGESQLRGPQQGTGQKQSPRACRLSPGRDRRTWAAALHRHPSPICPPARKPCWPTPEPADTVGTGPL